MKWSRKMSLTTLQFMPEIVSPLTSIHGKGSVSFSVGSDGICRLQHLYQSDPVRVLFPISPRGEVPCAVFVTTSGGLVGGDIIELAVKVDNGGFAQITSQAAEKIYRSTGNTCQINVSLIAQNKAWLEWLPQETIIFDGGRLHRKTIVNVAKGSRLLAGEVLVLGRSAMGEKVRTGLIRDNWEISYDGRFTWADALYLDKDIESFVNHPAGLGSARALGTIVFAADNAYDYLDTARQLLATQNSEVRSGATVVGGLLVVRFMASDPYSLRIVFGDFWAGFRYAAAKLPSTLPRLWQI